MAARIPTNNHRHMPHRNRLPRRRRRSHGRGGAGILAVMNAAGEFPPLHIGPIELPGPAVLAPLAGYTDLPYRLICRQQGAPYCSTEVTLDTSINFSPKLRRRLIQTHPDDHPLGGQIMGRSPETMAQAAGHLVAMGCDVVDLNFACPVRKVLRRRRGGHMMRDPATAIATIRAVIAAVEVPVTVKLRRSFDEADTSCQAFWQIAEAAFDAGAAAICVHGRSVEARYNGPADWGLLASAKRRFAEKVVLGSGDLLTADDGVRMLAETGVDGIVFARGALGNPWIFRQFRQRLAGETPAPPTLAEQRALLEAHYALSVDCFGPRHGPRRMYRFGIRYAAQHPHAKLVRQAFIRSKEKDGLSFQDILDRYYGETR